MAGVMTHRVGVSAAAGSGGGGGAGRQYIVLAGGSIPIFINQSVSANLQYATPAGYVNEKP